MLFRSLLLWLQIDRSQTYKDTHHLGSTISTSLFLSLSTVSSTLTISLLLFLIMTDQFICSVVESNAFLFVCLCAYESVYVNVFVLMCVVAVLLSLYIASVDLWSSKHGLFHPSTTDWLYCRHVGNQRGQRPVSQT